MARCTCGRKASREFSCVKCTQRKYCGIECQIQDWVSHQAQCSKSKSPLKVKEFDQKDLDLEPENNNQPFPIATKRPPSNPTGAEPQSKRVKPNPELRRDSASPPPIVEPPAIPVLRPRTILSNSVLTSVSGLAEPLSSSPSGFFSPMLGYTDSWPGHKRVYGELVDAFRLHTRSAPMAMSFDEWMVRVARAGMLPHWWTENNRVALDKYVREDPWGRLNRVVTREEIQIHLPEGHKGRILALERIAAKVARMR